MPSYAEMSFGSPKREKLTVIFRLISVRKFTFLESSGLKLWPKT
jgi:hypothetical protein